jgi:hypothetical protein
MAKKSFTNVKAGADEFITTPPTPVVNETPV